MAFDQDRYVDKSREIAVVASYIPRGGVQESDEAVFALAEMCRRDGRFVVPYCDARHRFRRDRLDRLELERKRTQSAEGRRRG